MSARRRQQGKIMRLRESRILRENSKHTVRYQKETQQIHDEINKIKSYQILTADQHQILNDYLRSLEEATGYFFSLYICYRNSIYRRSHYRQTVHLGSLTSRGPIHVTMSGLYSKYSGIYSSIQEFNQNILKPLHSVEIQPTIYTGVLVDARFHPENPIQLEIRSHGYDSIQSDLLGTIKFAHKYLNRIRIGTLDQIPSEYHERLQNIRRESFGEKDYDFYWVQGLNNCGNLFPYDPVNPSSEWSEYQKMELFEYTLTHRAIKI
jgi:hypothetical protein